MSRTPSHIQPVRVVGRNRRWGTPAGTAGRDGNASTDRAATRARVLGPLPRGLCSRSDLGQRAGRPTTAPTAVAMTSPTRPGVRGRVPVCYR